MAENPLKGLMSISVDCGTTATTDRESQQTCQPRYQAPLQGYRQGLRGCQEPRKWLTQVRCGSGSRTGREPGAGSGCASIIQAKVMRPQHSPENAARERSRVRNLRQAFHTLQAALPSVPPDTKLSKLDVLVLATNYIAHLTETLDNGGALAEHTLSSRPGGYLHPVKKWPMRSLLYCGSVGELLTGVPTNQTPLAVPDEPNPLTPSPDAADSE